jgi:hypothetical protein
VSAAPILFQRRSASKEDRQNTYVLTWAVHQKEPTRGRNSVIKRAVAVLGVSLAFVTLSADIAPPKDIPARARGAGRVVVARVLDVRSQFASNEFGDQLIVSTAQVEVEESLKGGPATVLDVEYEGGTVGDLTLKVSDLPSLEPGERAVFFLEGGRGVRFRLHDRGRGILKLSERNEVQATSMTLAEVRAQVRQGLGAAR